MQKRSRILMAVVALMLIATAFLGGCSGQKTLKIGMNAQLTGADSYIGQAAKLAIEDRIAEINAAGGIKGYKVELVVYDSRSDATEAVAIARRLMSQDKVVGIIGPEWSGASIPIAGVAAQQKVPVVATTASNIMVTMDENNKVQPYMFRVCFIDPYQGTALADYAYNELGKRKAAFITDVTAAYSVGIQNFFEEQFVKLGGELVAKEGYQANDTEFRAQLANVGNTDADLIVVPTATYRDIALIAQQARALGLTQQFIGGDGWISDDLLTMAGKELEGAVISSGVSTEDPMFKDWNAAFEAKHNIKPTTYAYYALDALYALEYAIGVSIDKVGKPDPTAVRDALESMTDVQVFTSKLTMEPDTHNPHNKPISMLGIQNNKWVILKTYEPQD